MSTPEAQEARLVNLTPEGTEVVKRSSGVYCVRKRLLKQARHRTALEVWHTI